MKKDRSSKRKNIQRYMLRSYLSIAYISVFIEVILCICMVISANSTVKKDRDQALSKVISQMDMIWENIEERTDRVCRDSLIQDALLFKAVPEYHGENVLKIRDMMELFRKEEEYYPEIGGMFFIDQAQQTVVDDSKIFHGEAARDLLSSMMLSEAILGEIGPSRRAMLFLSGETITYGKICYIQGIFSRSYQIPNGYLVTSVNETFILERLNLLGNTDELFFALYRDKVIGNAGADPDLAVRIEMDPENTRIRSGDTSWIISRASSGHPDISYVYAVTAASAYRPVAIVIVFTLITLAALLVSSLLFARRYTKRHTEPLRQIMDTIQDADRAGESFTYDQMTDMVSRLFRRVSQFEQQNEKDILPRIFSGQVRNQTEIEKYEKQHEEELKDGFYVLCVRLISLGESEDADLMVFCVMNIFEEMLREHLILRPVESWDRVYFIVREKSGPVEEKVIACKDYMTERLSFKVVCGLSGKTDHLAKISGAKDQADYMANYYLLGHHKAQTLWYDELIKLDEMPMSVFGDTVKRIINLTLAREYGTALEVLQELWETELSSHRLDAEDVRSKLLTIMTIVSIPHRERFGIKPPLPREQWNHIPVIYEDICQMMTELRDSREAEGDPGRNTYEKMRNYILEHACDPDITARSVAEEFDLTGSYASSMFKKYAGEGILELIHKERIRQGKELLKDGCSVQDAAEKTGYLDSRSFIRAFKKYEGITPGQYKAL